MGVGEKTDSGQASSFPGGGWGCAPGYRTRIERGPARLTGQCLVTTGAPGPLRTCGMWLSRPRSSSEVSEPGSRALMGWWTETRAREALSLLGRQGDWALTESLQVIHSASPISSQCPCGSLGTAVALKETWAWRQELPHGVESCSLPMREAQDFLAG